MDSVAAIYLANENDRAEVRGFLSALARRAYEGDRSVLLLAHPPKSGSDYSGSTDWLAGVRALWTLGPRRGSFMPHAELATSWRMNTSGCRFCRRSAPAPDAGGYITGPRPGDGGPGNEPFTLTCFSIGAAVSLVVGPRPRPPGPTLQSRRSESWNSIHHSPPAARTRQSDRPRSKSTRPSRPATSMVASSTRSGPSQPPHSSTSRCGLSASASSGSRSKEGNT